MTTQSFLAARRLINSGRGQSADWTIPHDEVEARQQLLERYKSPVIKGYLNQAEVDKTY